MSPIGHSFALQNFSANFKFMRLIQPYNDHGHLVSLQDRIPSQEEIVFLLIFKEAARIETDISSE